MTRAIPLAIALALILGNCHSLERKPSHLYPSNAPSQVPSFNWDDPILTDDLVAFPDDSTTNRPTPSLTHEPTLGAASEPPGSGCVVPSHPIVKCADRLYEKCQTCHLRKARQCFFDVIQNDCCSNLPLSKLARRVRAKFRRKYCKNGANLPGLFWP